jgi:hypothetical protein
MCLSVHVCALNMPWISRHPERTLNPRHPEGTLSPGPLGTPWVPVTLRASWAPGTLRAPWAPGTLNPGTLRASSLSPGHPEGTLSPGHARQGSPRMPGVQGTREAWHPRATLGATCLQGTRRPGHHGGTFMSVRPRVPSARCSQGAWRPGHPGAWHPQGTRGSKSLRVRSPGYPGGTLNLQGTPKG